MEEETKPNCIEIHFVKTNDASASQYSTCIWETPEMRIRQAQKRWKLRMAEKRLFRKRYLDLELLQDPLGQREQVVKKKLLSHRFSPIREDLQMRYHHMEKNTVAGSLFPSTDKLHEDVALNRILFRINPWVDICFDFIQEQDDTSSAVVHTSHHLYIVAQLTESCDEEVVMKGIEEAIEKVMMVL